MRTAELAKDVIWIQHGRHDDVPDSGTVGGARARPQARYAASAVGGSVSAPRSSDSSDSQPSATLA